MENTFKGTVFGGFNRDDVIRYIEKTALENKQQLEQLEQENDGLCRESAALRDELAAAKSEHERLSESYSEALALQDTLKKQLSEAQERLSALTAGHEEAVRALDALRESTAQELAAAKNDCARRLADAGRESEARLAQQQAECEQTAAAAERRFAARLSEAEGERDRLAAENAALRPQLEEYARVKAHIADIELSARERAEALDTATRAKLQSLVDACTKQCELVIATLGTTCANVSSELRRTDAMVSQLPAAFNTLRTDLKELQKLEKGQ